MKAKRNLTKHHRRPRSRGGDNSEKNISLVPCNQHEAYHLLFANYLPEKIAEILNDKWIDPDYMFIVVKR